MNIRRQAIRALGVEESGLCPLCMKSYAEPFRSYDDQGKVNAGCVDACHSKPLVGLDTPAAHWQFRKEAQKVRENYLHFLILRQVP
jgi:hypothetical protein